MHVSVIIPTYNCERYIGEAIESVLRQTRKADEILVVDDGSTDNTLEVLKRYSGAITVVAARHGGVSAARNIGLEKASGEVVGFLDADDLWLPNMLEEQVALLAADPAISCVFSNFVRFNTYTGSRYPDQFTYYPELHSMIAEKSGLGFGRIIRDDPFSQLVQMNEIPTFTQVMLFRRELIDGIRFNERLWCCEDTHFGLRTFARGAVAFNDRVLAEVRRHDHNVTADLDVFPRAKVQALEALRDSGFPLNGRQIRSLESRILRANAGYASFLVRKEGIAAAWRHYFSFIFNGGILSRKIRLTAKLVLETFVAGLVRSARC